MRRAAYFELKGFHEIFKYPLNIFEIIRFTGKENSYDKTV